MKLRDRFFKASFAFLVSAVLLTMMGCPDKGDGSPTNLPTRTPNHCKDQSADEAGCRADKICTWDDAKKVCQDADAALKNKCAAIQAKKPCEDDATCEWDAAVTPNVCKDKIAPVLTKYSLYTFGAVASGAAANEVKSYNMKIHSVVSSGAGAVYVAGQGNAARNGTNGNVATVDKTTDGGANWQAINLATGNTPAATGVNDMAKDHNDAKIKIVGSLHDGVIVYQPRGNILGILSDATNNATLTWTVAQANLTGAATAPTSFVEVAKGGNYFIYASTAIAANGIGYFERGVGVDNWIIGYTKDGAGTALTRAYSTFAFAPNGDLLMAANDGSINGIVQADLGVNVAGNKKLAIGGGGAAAALIPANPNLQHTAGTANGAITSMLLVENKYLLVGFKGKAANRGGLFFADISAGLPGAAAQWAHTAANDHNINGMILDRTKPSRAIIATDIGVMIFDEGRVVEVVAGADIIDTAAVALPANAGDITAKATAKTGFAGVLAQQNLTHVAQDVTGKFYFASPNGVMTMTIDSRDF